MIVNLEDCDAKAEQFQEIVQAVVILQLIILAGLGRPLGTDQQLKRRISTQKVGIHRVLVSCGDLIEPLAQKVGHRVLNVARVATVSQETFGAAGQPQPLIQLTEHDQAGITGEGATLEVQSQAGLKFESRTR